MGNDPSDIGPEVLFKYMREHGYLDDKHVSGLEAFVRLSQRVDRMAQTLSILIYHDEVMRIRIKEIVNLIAAYEKEVGAPGFEYDVRALLGRIRSELFTYLVLDGWWHLTKEK